MSIRLKLLFPILILFLSIIFSGAVYLITMQRITTINTERAYLTELRQQYVIVRNQLINFSHEAFGLQYGIFTSEVEKTNLLYEKYNSSLSFLYSTTPKVIDSLDTIKKLQYLTNRRTEEMNKRADTILQHINEVFNYHIWGVSIYSLYVYGQAVDIAEVEELYADVSGFFRYMEILNGTLDESISTIDTNFKIIDREIEHTIFLSQLYAALIILALMVSAFLISIFISGKIAGHIVSIEKKVNIIKNGDLKTRLVVRSKDELGSLSEAFNSMTENLDKIHNELEHRVKERTAELTRANVRLSKLDKLKDDFLAATSHELRTPLNGIIGISESMTDGKQGGLSPHVARNIEMITSSARRLNSLVNDILDFTSMKSSQLELSFSSVDLYSLVEMVVMILTPLVLKKNINLINNIDRTLPPVKADENRLEQVFYNLVGNAIKFTASGEIQVNAVMNKEEGQMLISVSDTGIGIPTDKQDIIFNSFEQADGSINKEYGGTGLGLTITKRILELHDSSIFVESEVGKGSVFSFKLPISFATVVPAQKDLAAINSRKRINMEEPVEFDESSETDDPLDKDKTTVLVVDDEPVNIYVLSNMLGRKYRIIKKLNGFDALDYLKDNKKPDLVLLDMMMPKLSGLEVCKTIRKQYTSSELPVIFLTAKNRIEDLIAGFEAGASDYITKPFLKEELFARIETQLKLEQQQNELKEKERLKSELAIAARIQTAIVPRPLAHNELEISAFMIPSDEVGGDYYDIVEDINNDLWFAVGDVSGHGLTAGLIMMMAQTSFISHIKTASITCEEALEFINNVLFENIRNRLEIFHMMTMCLVKYHGQGQYTYSGAAHCDIIVYRHKTDTCELLPTKGAYLGAIPSIKTISETGSITLAEGDLIILYTDGIIEARQKGEKELFDMSRLEQIIKKHKAHPAELTEVTRNAVLKWSRNILSDDSTMVVIKQTHTGNRSDGDGDG